MIKEETKELITKNLGLVYGFMKDKGIYDLDLFQELSMYLCKQTDKYYDAKRSTFSTFAYYILNNYMTRVYKRQQRQSSLEALNIDELSESENTTLYENVMRYDEPLYEDIIEDEQLSQIISSLRPQRRKIIKMWVDGYTDTEVAKKLGISKQAVNHFRHTLIKKIKERR